MARESIKVPTATYNKIIFVKALLEQDLQRSLPIWEAIDAVFLETVLRITKDQGTEIAPELLTPEQQQDAFKMVQAIHAPSQKETA